MCSSCEIIYVPGDKMRSENFKKSSKIIAKSIIEISFFAFVSKIESVPGIIFTLFLEKKDHEVIA